ncbi:surfeit locus protein 6 homolog [Uranotaenia lowii]|uniref:surfeit locus protein 6 homolog n=1 Tax=Uranotaenia lowii TaxID=190385 RepID=UPI00247A1C03|nr:surfeit locus protein 6 homolog [Uranotaenia lowii]
MKKAVSHMMVDKLRSINDRFMYLLEAFQIPSKKADDINCDEYLLDSDPKVKQSIRFLPKKDSVNEAERDEVMKNKINSKYLHRQKKVSSESKAIRKQLSKKSNMKKSLRKMQLLERKALTTKQDIKIKEEKPSAPPTKTFNSESKIVFSRIQLDESDIPKKGIETDSKKLLRKVLKEKKELNDLKNAGESDKYAEIKSKNAWNRATAKTLGHKIRDDVNLLSKKIQKRKKQIKKSKDEWTQRKQKIEYKKDLKQKKRTENIKERADKKKNKKMQKLAKKGRIIPGF